MGNTNSCCCVRREDMLHATNTVDQSNFSDNPTFNLQQKVYYSPRSKAEIEANKQGGSLTSKLSEFKLRFNQKFYGDNQGETIASTQSNLRSYTRQKNNPFSPHGENIDEIVDEDLNNSNDENVRRKRQLLCSMNISALTAGLQHGDDLIEYETLTSSTFYTNGKLLLIFGEFQGPRSGQNQGAPSINFDLSTRLPSNQGGQHKKILINSKIYDLFHSTHGDSLIDIMGVNQIINIQPLEIHKEDDHHQHENSYIRETRLLEKVMSLLKYSHQFQNINKVQMQYETETSYTFRVNQKGYEQVKLKLPKEGKQININELGILEDLVFEAQLQKLIYDQNYVNEVKEEIIMINALDQSVSDYLVIIEEPDLSLHDLYHLIRDPRDHSVISQGIWHGQIREHKDHFSIAKYMHYFFKAMQSLRYLHKNGVVLSGIRPDEILIDRQTQTVKFKSFIYSSVLTKDGRPLISTQIENDNHNDSSRIDTSRTDDIDHDIFGDGNTMRNYEIYKLKRYDERYCYTKEVRDVFNKNYRKELFKFNKIYCHSLFLQSQNYSEQSIKFNDVAALLECFKMQNVKEMISYNILSTVEIQILNMIDREIQTDINNFSKNKQILKVLISRIKTFVFCNQEVLNFLIDQNILEENYQFAIYLCSISLDLETYQKYGQLHMQEESGVILQQKIKDFHIKRAKIYRLQYNNQKLALKDIKQALFILNMHFQQNIEEKTSLMMDMIELLIEINDLNDAVVKLQSVESQIKMSQQGNPEGNLYNNTKLMLKYNDIRAKIYELKKDKQRKHNVDTESFQMCLSNTSGDYRSYKVQEYQEKIIESQILKGSYEEAKSSITKMHNHSVQLYGEFQLQSFKQQLFKGQIEWAKCNHDEALNYYTGYLDQIREHFPENSVQRSSLYDIIALVLRDKKFYQKSQQFFERALHIKLNIYGECNINTAQSYYNMGVLLQLQNLNEGALEYFNKNLPIQQKLNSGNEYFSMHQIYQSLGQTYKAIKNYEKASFYFEKCVNLLIQNSSKQNPNNQLLMEVYNDLGIIYRMKQDYNKAINNFKDCLKLKKKLVSNQNDQQLQFLYQSLASLYLNIKKYERSLEYTQSEINILQHHYGVQHSSLANPYYRIGFIYFSIGNQDKALISLKEARGILRQNMSLGESKNTSMASPDSRRGSTTAGTTNNSTISMSEKDLLYRVEQLISECSTGKNTQFARVSKQKASDQSSPYKMSIFQN